MLGESEYTTAAESQQQQLSAAQTRRAEYFVAVAERIIRGEKDNRVGNIEVGIHTARKSRAPDGHLTEKWRAVVTIQQQPVL